MKRHGILAGVGGSDKQPGAAVRTLLMSSSQHASGEPGAIQSTGTPSLWGWRHALGGPDQVAATAGVYLHRAVLTGEWVADGWRS